MHNCKLKKRHRRVKSAETSGLRTDPAQSKASVKRGRPSTYNSARPAQVLEIMSLGFSLDVVAAAMEVSRAALYAWAKSHPEFSAALELGKARRVLKLECDLLSTTNPTVMRRSIFLLQRAAPDEWRATRKRRRRVAPRT
jgi:hypothetical protein